MQLTVSKKDLSRLATRMVAVADRKSTMPTLSMTLLRATSKSLEGVATDLYLAVRDTIPAEGSPGAVVVNAADFLSRIKVLPDGPVTLTSKGDGLTLKAAGSARKFTLRTAAPDDFPPVPQPDGDAPVLKVDPGILARIIHLTAFAMSPDESRAHLSSLLVEWEGDTIHAVATDGHRLSRAACKVEGQASASMLIPAKAVHEIRRLADDAFSGEDAAPIAVVQSGPTVFLTSGTVTFSAKLTDSQFPPWRSVVPASSSATARIGRAAFLDAIKAVSVAADDKSGVRCAFSAGRVQLSSSSPDKGDGTDELPADYSGPNLSIGFNAKYMIDVLSALACDEVTVALEGELDPILVRPVGDTADEALFVVMPMRI